MALHRLLFSAVISFYNLFSSAYFLSLSSLFCYLLLLSLRLEGCGRERPPAPVVLSGMLSVRLSLVSVLIMCRQCRGSNRPPLLRRCVSVCGVSLYPSCITTAHVLRVCVCYLRTFRLLLQLCLGAAVNQSNIPSHHSPFFTVPSSSLFYPCNPHDRTT